MRENDLNLSSTYRLHNYYIKMTKTRTVTFLIMIISTCALILSFTDAYPTEGSTEPNITTEAHNNSNGNMQLAITHVVKTIEFEVDVIEDDANDFDNSTDMTTQEYMETDIKLLNMNLLRELLERATEGDVDPSSKKPEEEGSVTQTEPQN